MAKGKDGEVIEAIGGEAEIFGETAFGEVAFLIGVQNAQQLVIKFAGQQMSLGGENRERLVAVIGEEATARLYAEYDAKDAYRLCIPSKSSVEQREAYAARRSAVLEWRRQRMSIREIAFKVGLTERSVYYILKS